ncbi:MAG: M1 family aminopeptidase [Bacteroidota bacterium]|nr:M1 family aminopeptidase [Bacteroidota bacterium]
MKYILLSLLVISIGLSQIVVPTGAELCSQKRLHQSKAYAKITSLATAKHSFDVLDYNLNLDLYKNFSPPFPHSFGGSVTITLRADSTLSSIQLDATNASLIIDSVHGPVMPVTHLNNTLFIPLNSTHSVSDTVQVTIFYRHKDVADEAFLVGTDGMVFTDCEPERARNWFPCWDKPSDKATTELFAKVPTSVKLGSNGRLIDSLHTSDTTMVYHWKSRDPIATYLVVISAKVNYNLDIVYWKKFSNPNDSIPIVFYWNPGEEPGLSNIKAKIIPMTNYYSTLFGEHAFEKNGFATLNSLFPWGGMENQTLTSLIPNGYASENLVSHEYAHQWFGDMITCGTWADVWLNEGFATYCEALWSGRNGNYSAYKNYIDADANSYLAHNPGWAIYNPDWAVSTPSLDILFNGAITYDKGACVLHMLRYVLGDSLFFATIHSYGTSSQFRLSNSTTDDFVHHINTATQSDLTWFFDEWVKTPNHPAYFVNYSLNVSDSSATVLVKQTQSTSEYWKMPIEVKFSLVGGKDTTMKIWDSINGEVFHFKLNSVPLSMVFDPNNNIVLKSAYVTQVKSISDNSVFPAQFALQQNYPNPFNPSTTIAFSIPTTSLTTLTVYDILGKEIATLVNEKLPAGYYEKQFNASTLPSGVYFYRLVTDAAVSARKMIILK